MIRRLLFWSILLGCFSLHVFQSVRCFRDWAHLVDPQTPIVQIDHSLHLYHGWLNSEALREHGTNWCYDPFFMAGYPNQTPSSSISTLSQLIAGDYSVRAYKIGLFTSMILSPIAVLLGCHLIGLRRGAILCLAILFPYVYWMRHLRPMLDQGLFGFLGASCWSILIFGTVLQWRRSPNWLSWLGMTVAVSFGLFLHPMTGFVIGPGLVCFYLIRCRGKSRSWQVCLFLSVLVVLAVNSFWLYPLWKLGGHYRPPFVFRVTTTLSESFSYFDNRWNAILAVLALFGIVRIGFQKRFTQFTLLLSSTLCLFALLAFGSFWSGTRWLEPLRFVISFEILLAILAAEGIALFATLFRFGSPLRNVRSFFILITIGMTCYLMARDTYEMFKGLVVYHRPFPMGINPMMNELVEWIQKNTDDSARVMVEDQLRLFEYDVPRSVHWTPLLPILTGRQFIGGLYQTAQVQEHYASFGDFNLGLRDIRTISDGEIRDYLERFNVGWIVSWSKPSRDILDGLSFLEPVAELHRYTNYSESRFKDERMYRCYRVKLPHSFFAQGAGKVVRVNHNVIELENLVPRDKLIVLRYHWLETLRTDGDVKLEQVAVDGDPIGFIGIRSENAIPKLKISNGYRWP